LIKLFSKAGVRSVATLDVTPKTGNVGQTLTISGKGLAKSKQYNVLFAGSKTATFKTTPAGAVPPRLRITIPDVPTNGAKGELGTKISIDVVTRTKGDATASTEFELQASATSETKTAYLGDQVMVHGRGLLANENYQISLISPGYIPYAAGLMDAGPNGSGKTTIIIPDYVGAGAFQIDLLNRKGVYRALQKTAPFGIMGFSYKSLDAGKPKRSTGGLNCPVQVSIPFRNNSSITFLPVIYAIIYNTDGQPIQITSSGAGLSPHSTSEVTFCLTNLQKGTYRLGVFATTGTGRVLSKLFSFPLTV
jgi:IPT/TIG domain